jgi:hypothetical protein
MPHVLLPFYLSFHMAPLALIAGEKGPMKGFLFLRSWRQGILKAREDDTATPHISTTNILNLTNRKTASKMIYIGFTILLALAQPSMAQPQKGPSDLFGGDNEDPKVLFCDSE